MYATGMKHKQAKLLKKKAKDKATKSKNKMSVEAIKMASPAKKKSKVKFDFEGKDRKNSLLKKKCLKRTHS